MHCSLMMCHVSGDSLGYHNSVRFTTRDSDNDGWYGNCATKHAAGWWYDACRTSNLNGLYNTTISYKGITWGSFTGNHLSATRMMVRPR